ncbi:Root UVB sensitive family [Dillenia turbinata]|uniref:Root UVB sensitive family n=1 Tax=Dillenia turbinata TaxID=194707 RepID=A0AAN8UQU7_9MAGN
MQFTLQSIPNSSRFQFPRKSYKNEFYSSNPTPFQPKPSPKNHFLLSNNALRTSSFDYEFLDQGTQQTQKLPIVIRDSGQVSRYFWDGSSLNLVRVDGGGSPSSSSSSKDDFKEQFLRFCSSSLRNFFIPRRVSGNYTGYVKWKFLHRVFSSALQVLATQAMFRAIGVGYSRSLSSAAALNWVLKDGLGRLSRCIYTASFASAFDTNLKRVRFSTSVLFSLSIGIELLTPILPQYFLLLATVANIAKQISLACHLATASAVHRSFAIADNLGEISAKAQIQTVCFDNLGLVLAALLNLLARNSPRLQAGLPFLVYPVFSMIDLFGIYRALEHVHLQTLTKDRLEIILTSWIRLGYVPSAAEVSKEEGISFWGKNGRKQWPIRIGCLDSKAQLQKLSMMTMRSLSVEDFYFICLETSSEQDGMLLCLREGAGIEDIIMGLLQACYMREALMSGRWGDILKANEIPDFLIREWFKLVKESKQLAQADSFRFMEQMIKSGWATKNILLSNKEQARYSFVGD